MKPTAFQQPIRSRLPPIQRCLIVNADDFGLSVGVNRGIIEAHLKGIVTSASLMVRWPAAAEAATMSRGCESLSIGLHFDLGEWVYREGTWSAWYEVVPLDDRIAVNREAGRQLDCFRELMGRNPTHLDSHQHVHRDEPVRSILQSIAEKICVPLRHFCPHIQYSGSFYGQTATGEALPKSLAPASLIELLHELPPGTTELGCHPALACDANTTYCHERLVEVKTLCDPRVRLAIGDLGIKLCSFHDVPWAVNSPVSNTSQTPIAP